MMLPKNQPIKQVRKKKTIWLYGEPYTGKTTFASQFPNHLFLTTDGNIRELMTYAADEMPPSVEIKDIKIVEGRITKHQFAWEIFKNAVTALETQDNDFDTIVVDHLGDLYEHCRLFIYDREGVNHETEDKMGFGKGWDMVKIEFLSTIKRLVNLDYENIILISHEDRTKDITSKSGNKFTAIKPKLRDAFLSNVAGMVDITARTLAEHGKHTLSFKKTEVVFGGGRLNLSVDEIPLEYGEFLKLYDESGDKGTTPTKPAARQPRKSENEPPKDTEVDQSTDAPKEDEPPFDADDPADAGDDAVSGDGEAESPADPPQIKSPADKPARTRRKRSE